MTEPDEATLTDEEIDTRDLHAASPSVADDGDDSGDTGDDSGDTGDTGDDSGDTGDDSAA